MTVVELMGAPGSPYTRKMLALMRYRHIPYRISWQSITSPGDSHKNRPKPKVALLPTYYLPDANGETQAVTDSTPILRRFEEEYGGRSVIPSDAIMAFLNWLLEDYGDEWLTKSMFHYRWHYAADIKKAGSILPRWATAYASSATCPTTYPRRCCFTCSSTVNRFLTCTSCCRKRSLTAWRPDRVAKLTVASESCSVAT